MNAYPSLRRWAAAVITALVVGLPVAYVMTRGESNVVEVTPALAQGGKAGAGDWIMYGGSPARNMVNTIAKGLPTTWDVDTKKNIKWFAELGSKAYGGPIVAGGRVFIGTNNQTPRDKAWIKPLPVLDDKTLKPKLDKNGKQIIKLQPVDLGIVMAFEEATGQFQWQAVHEKLPGGQVVDWPREGICSSAFVKGNRLYYVSNRCEVVCADVATGKAAWKVDMIGQLGVFPHNIADGSPLIVGDQLYVVTSNGVNQDHITVPAPKAPSFIRIKVAKDKGDVTWQDNSPTASLLVAPKGQLAQKDFLKALVNSGKLIQHGQWANPAYGVVNGQKQVIFPGGDGWIYGFDADARPGDAPIWKFDANPKDSKYELAGKGTRSDFIATPVIYKNRVYIGVGQDPEHRTGVGHFYCIDMTKKGDISPDLVTDDSVFPPKTKANPNSGMVWHYGGAITDPAVQRKLKRNYYFGRTMSTAAIHEDIVYITDLNGVLHVLDADKGTKHWEFDTRADIWSSPYYADGKVYLGTDDNVVYVFKHGKVLNKLAENDMGARVRATPVAANGVLYVMTENKLYAIK
ncbi:MAG: PQQ-binding-like beta-propeller repeat protein [Planctomycetes bacterium]|nr:PQQ-binding-like beta-propeller repeat protein [Planctomycetota bacterium]